MAVKKIGSVVGKTVNNIPGTIGDLVEGALYATGGGIITELSEVVAEDVIGVDPLIGKAGVAIGARKVLPGKLGIAAEIIAMKEVAEDLFAGRAGGRIADLLGGAGGRAESAPVGVFK